MWSELRGVGVATAVSIAAHVAFAAAMLSVAVDDRGITRIAPDAIAIEVVAPEQPMPERELRPEPVDAPTPEPVEPEAVEPEAVEPQERAEATSPPEGAPAALVDRPLGTPDGDPNEPATAGDATAAGDTTSGIDVPEVTPDRSWEAMSEEERRRVQALINPAAVAGSSFTATGPGPSRTGPPAGLGSGRDRGPSEEEIEASLSAGLRREAMARAYLSRAEPELQRQADGSYAYTGHRFTARIRPDGEVDWDDQPNVQTNGFSTSGTMDITEAFMSASGQDPAFVEREWFLEHTRELRERLEDEWRARTMDSAVRVLPGRLRRIWATESRTPTARRLRIFRIWDEMSEDGTGARARRVVLSWIRENLPEGSDDAYTDAELARLNGRRESEEAFAPY